MGRGVVALKLDTLAVGGPDEDSYQVDNRSLYK